MVFIGRCRIDVIDGSMTAVLPDGDHVHLPLGGITCLFLEPGARISHEAVKYAALTGTLIQWVGEGGVRFYAAGQVGGAKAEHLLWQARMALDEKARLRIVRKMYALRFGDEPPRKRSVNQLRGIEGSRVKATYRLLARQYGVNWSGRRYDPHQFNASDSPNQALSTATACLYGITEAAVIAAGYSPAIGFLHTGKPQSFVYDIADIIKFETVVPLAFKIAAQYERGDLNNTHLSSAVRHACRDEFRTQQTLAQLIPLIDEVLQAGGLPMPEPPPEAALPAIPQKTSGDVGHRG